MTDRVWKYRPGTRVRMLGTEAVHEYGVIESVLDTSQCLDLVVEFPDGRKVSCTDAHVEIVDVAAGPHRLSTTYAEGEDYVTGICSCGQSCGGGTEAEVFEAFNTHAGLAKAVENVAGLAELARRITGANGEADRSTYKNLVTEGWTTEEAVGPVAAALHAEADALVKGPPAGDKLVAHEVDPEQLCGLCLHPRRRHLDDGPCHRRDPHLGDRCRCQQFNDGPPEIEDPTRDPTVEQLPAVTTSFTPEQFKAWLESEGQMFVVYLPGRKSFVIKVPDEHNAFFVAMMQQVRFALGSEVQAVRMTVMSGPPADAEAADATAYAPGTDPAQYARFTEPHRAAAEAKYKAPPEQFTPGQPRKVKCTGSGKPSPKPRDRNVNPTADNPGYSAGRGPCPECSGDYKLTHAGNVRVHHRRT